MILGNRRFWRITAWPTLIHSLIYFAWFPFWFQAQQLHAQQIPEWDGNEYSVPIEFSILNDDDRAVLPQQNLSNQENLRKNDHVMGRGLAAKAAQLENHPVKIYEFVRNEIEFEPYIGTRFGAVGTLDRRRGNDIDQAFLLAALLRAAYRQTGRTSPDLSLVQGDIILSKDQLLNWLGVDNGPGAKNVLDQAGIDYLITGHIDQNFSIEIKNHTWLRAKVSYSPLRGGRYNASAEQVENVTVDLDPSMVIQQEIERIETPFQMSGVQPDEFLAQIAGASETNLPAGSVNKLPESYMLTVVDSGAAVFRRLVREMGLTVEQALRRRRPTVEQIDSLPDALPFIMKRAPETIDLNDSGERDQFLSAWRHVASVRVEKRADAALLTEIVMPTSELYGKPLTLGFETLSLPPEDLDLAEIPSVPVAWQQLTPQLRLAGGELPDPPPATPEQIAYGTPVRLVIATQRPDGNPSFLDPLADPLATRDTFETRAGSLLALSFVTSISEHNYPALFEEATSYVAGLPSATFDNAAGFVGPVMHWTSQVILAQQENLTRLGAAASGHAAWSENDWTIAGLEPVPGAADGSFAQPRWVFANREGTQRLGETLPADDPLKISSDSAQNLLQLTREAVLSQAPALALGKAVAPISAGRLIREANTRELPIYAVDHANSTQLDFENDRVPPLGGAGGLLRENLGEAAAQSLLILPSAQLAAPLVPEQTPLGWSYFEHYLGSVWKSQAFTPAGVPARASSAQQDELTHTLNPADLIVPGRNAAYRAIADEALHGLETWRGASVSTAQAYVAAVHPLAKLVEHGQSSEVQADRALGFGGAIVLLNALLEEFSRPEVISIGLEVTDDGVTRQLKPGDVFNPANVDIVKVVGQFSQIMETYEFRAFDGANTPVADSQGAPLTTNPKREVTWQMQPVLPEDPPETEPEDFTWATDNDYDGPLEIRLQGTVYGRATRARAERFIIDCLNPQTELYGWEAGSVQRGPVSIFGNVNDSHLVYWKAEIKPAAAEPPVPFRVIAEHGSPAATESITGASGLLATWDARDLDADGNYTVDANGDYVVRITALDLAGNESSATASLSAVNDTRQPVITLELPSTQVVKDSFTVKGDARDEGLHNSGVRSFKAWLEFSRGVYEKVNPTDQFKTLIVTPETRVLADEQFATVKPVHEFDITGLDSLALQGYANAPITLHVKAVDDFGNIAMHTKILQAANPVFNAYLHPAAFRLGNRSELLVFTGSQTRPTVKISKKINDVLTDIAVPSFVTTQYFGQYKSYLHVFSWDGTLSAGGYVTSGRFEWSIAYPGLPQPKKLDGFFLENLPSTEPSGFISDPLNTILLKNIAHGEESEPGRVPIMGWVRNKAFELLFQGDEPPASTPIGRKMPAERPYWLLSYKPSSAQPEIDTKIGVGEQLPENLKFASWPNQQNFEPNWVEIAHGYTDVDATPDDPETENIVEAPTPEQLAVWDISRLPVGMYDLRLVVTDGVERYMVGYFPGYRVVHGATLPGEDPDDRTPGALKLRQVDFSVNFEGFPIEIAREYNSLRAHEKGDFGWGWTMYSTTLKIAHSKNSPTGMGMERLEADITLPDGRTFTYANEPLSSAQLNFDYMDNSWANEEAFLSRPYGQMLWLPGRINANDLLSGVYLNYPGHRTDASFNKGYKRVKDWKSAEPDGTIACLQVEDGSYILFRWETGELLEQNYDDGKRKITYASAAVTPEIATQEGFAANPPSERTVVSDHLGRSIKIFKDDKDRVVAIKDARGKAVRYDYNDKDELVKVTDRAGGVRELFYEHPDFPHYLTRVRVSRGNGQSPVEINYSYDDNARLGGIDTGAGDINMEYEDLDDGGGRQTVVDEALNGRTVIEHDEDGRVTKQIDAAGVVTRYEYQQNHVYHNNDENSFVIVPKGVPIKQVVGGVETEFEYDVSAFSDTSNTYFGYEGMAQRFVDFWAHTGSAGDVVNEYIGDQTQLQPGYLTSMQVQPKEVNTPGIDENNAPVADNSVSLTYRTGAAEGMMPPGDSKIATVVDPEGRNIGLNYGETGNPAARNETGGVTGPGTKVTNTYIPFDDPFGFAGRINTSKTERTIPSVEELSRSTYIYTPLTGPDAGLTACLDAVDQLLLDYADDLDGATLPESISAEFAGVWIEKQEVTTITDNDPETAKTTTSYLDALGNPIASIDADGWQSFQYTDDEGRSILSATPEGSLTYNRYDSAGQILSTVSITGGDEPEVTFTTHEYDSQGRPTAVRRDGEIVGGTEYGETANLRTRASRDADDNVTTTFTDAANRVVREEWIGVNHSKRVTEYGYDDEGRRIFVRDPRGLETRTVYDAAGREIEQTVSWQGTSQVTKKGYYANGRLAWTQSPAQAAASSPVFTTYRYITAGGVENPSFGQLLAVYHEDDNKFAADNGATIEQYIAAPPYRYCEFYGYDTKGRQNEVKVPKVVYGNPVPIPVSTFTEFDTEGRQEFVTFNYKPAPAAATTDQNVKFQFTYNEETGERHSVIYPSGMTRLWSEIETQLEEVNSGRVETETRDPESGRVASVAKPEGTLTYAYDALGALESTTLLGKTVYYGYDAWGRLARVQDSADVWEYGYGIGGQVTRVENAHAGTEEIRDYDALGRLLFLEHRKAGDDSIIFKTQFTLAPDGNRLGTTETAADQSQSRWEYFYDPLGRLIEERYDANNDNDFEDDLDRRVAYSYDKDANRTMVRDYRQIASSRLYTYIDDTQQIDEIYALVGSGIDNPANYTRLHEKYLWTEKGELLEKHHYVNGTYSWKEIYAWGVNSTLLSVTFDGGPRAGLSVHYTYDDRNTLIRRTVKQNNAVVSDEKYLVDYNNLTGYSQTVAELGAVPGSDAFHLKRVNLFSDRILSQTSLNGSTAQTNYLLGDALGSIRAVTGRTADATNQVHQYRYTAFGSPIGEPMINQQLDYAFASEPNDQATELQYNRARWLSRNGSWITKDPAFDWPRNFGSKYNYAGLNPVNAVDPTGQMLAEVVTVSGWISTLGSLVVAPFIYDLMDGGDLNSAADAAWSNVKMALVALKMLALDAVKAFIAGNFFSFMWAQILDGFKSSLQEVKTYASRIWQAMTEGMWIAALILIVLLIAAVISAIFAYKGILRGKAKARVRDIEANPHALSEIHAKYGNIQPRGLAPGVDPRRRVFTPHPDAQKLSFESLDKPGKYCYVRHSDGTISIAPEGPGVHTQLSGPDPKVTAAGELEIDNYGRIKTIDNNSGAFQFDIDSVFNVRDQLIEMGFEVLRVNPTPLR